MLHVRSFWQRSGGSRRMLALLLGAIVVGVPVNSLVSFGLLLFLAVVVFTGEVASGARAWLAAGLLALAALALGFAGAPPRIDEGHNVFLVKDAENALVKNLPPDVYRIMAAEFDKVYPPEKRCDPAQKGCWRGQGAPDSVFAFSADGIFDRGPASRRIDDIDFSDPVWLRLGFINDGRYNWDSNVSDVKRLRRDGRFWMGLQRWHLLMPYFVSYRFPAAFAGSQLCWQGDVIWEERAERFTLLSNAAWACRRVETADVGHRVFGLGIRPGTLAMTLDPPAFLRVWQVGYGALRLLIFGAIVALLVKWRRRAPLLPLVMIVLSLFVIALQDASFIGGLRPLDAGDEGLLYEAQARGIVQDLIAGNLRAALQDGGGSGFPYLRAFERVVFGDSNLGYLAMMLALPFAYLALCRRFLPRQWALALMLVFIAVPVGRLLGTTFLDYAKWAARGFADPAAAFAALCGVVVLTRRPPQKIVPEGGARFGAACGASLLLALAVFIRPNLAPFAAIMLAGAGFAALAAKDMRRVAGLCLGFLPLAALAPYVPFAAAMPSLASLVTGLAGPSGLPVMLPLHAAMIGVLAYVAFARGRFEFWLRLMAGALLAQHAAALPFALSPYYLAPRYHLLAWLLTFVVNAAWFYEVAVPWLRQRWPQGYRRLCRNRASLAVSVALAQLDRLAPPAGR